MSDFFCSNCSDLSDEAEELCVGVLVPRRCDVCGKMVDPWKEKYSVFPNGAAAKFLAQRSAPPKEAK